MKLAVHKAMKEQCFPTDFCFQSWPCVPRDSRPRHPILSRRQWTHCWVRAPLCLRRVPPLAVPWFCLREDAQHLLTSFSCSFLILITCQRWVFPLNKMGSFLSRFFFMA
jgi:hypothetical protein